MTVKYDDRDAIAHGKITEKPLRERPKFPTWALKLTMAITGLIFGGFVLIHMIGNLKVFMPMHDGHYPIDQYGEFLREVGYPLIPHEGVLWIFRITLLASLILHVYGAFAITGRAHQSRGKFRRTNLMGGLNSFTARTMIVTGIVLLAFIIFHILDLTMGVAPAASDTFEHGAIYANLMASFSRWPVAIFYIIAVPTPHARYLDRCERPGYDWLAHSCGSPVRVVPGSRHGHGRQHFHPARNCMRLD